MKTTARNLAAISSSLLFASSLSHAATIIDDFNDGNDNGWVRYDPIGSFTGGAAASSYSFPAGNSYRIDATPSPSPGMLGASRAGAYRTDASYSNFRVTVDVISWDPSVSQLIGVVARGSNFGPGTTNGYAFSYVTSPGENGFIVISQITNEQIQCACETSFPVDVNLDPTNNYQFVFTGNGAVLTGEVFDLNNLSAPLASVSATSSTYTSGFVGLLTADAIDGAGVFANMGTGATFDNFSAIPEPGTAMLAALGCLGLLRRKRQH